MYAIHFETFYQYTDCLLFNFQFINQKNHERKVIIAAGDWNFSTSNQYFYAYFKRNYDNGFLLLAPNAVGKNFSKSNIYDSVFVFKLHSKL